MNNVSKGTLRRLYRRSQKPGFVANMFKVVGFFDGVDQTTFRKWVKLNVDPIRKYYDDRPAFTYPAAKLLGI